LPVDFWIDDVEFITDAVPTAGPEPAEANPPASAKAE
jgi:hypothetical protein